MFVLFFAPNNFRINQLRSVLQKQTTRTKRITFLRKVLQDGGSVSHFLLRFDLEAVREEYMNFSFSSNVFFSKSSTQLFQLTAFVRGYKGYNEFNINIIFSTLMFYSINKTSCFIQYVGNNDFDDVSDDDGTDKQAPIPQALSLLMNATKFLSHAPGIIFAFNQIHYLYCTFMAFLAYHMRKLICFNFIRSLLVKKLQLKKVL